MSLVRKSRTKTRLQGLTIGVLVLVAVALAIVDRQKTFERPDREDAVGGAKLLFASDFSNGLSEFPEQIHRERITVVDDPSLGTSRKVLRFEVHNSDTGPTENPRAQIETPYDFEEGDDRYAGFSYYFPEEFPTELPPRAWVSLGSIAYGPPYDGAGPLSIRVQNSIYGGGAEIRWQRNDTYDNDIPWFGPRLDDIRGRWVDFVIRTRLDSDPDEGFVELWMNTGSGWQKQDLDDQYRLHMKTYDDSNDGGPNSSRLGLYYRKDIPGPLVMYHGPMRIATAGEGAFNLVAPRSYR
jgi:hypothetical protein